MDIFFQSTQSAIEAAAAEEEEEVEADGGEGVLLAGKQSKRRKRRPSVPAHHLGVSCLFKQILREE